MIEALAFFFTPIVVALGWVAICAKGGYWWDSKVKQPVRDRVVAKLNKTFSEDDENAASLFVCLFDQIFDPEQRGRPLFRRSIIATCGAMALITIVWLARLFLSDAPYNPVADLARDFPLVLWSNVFVYGICTNIVGDFLSLWETRMVIGFMARARSRTQYALLFVDVVATTFIYSISLVFALSIGVFLDVLVPSWANGSLGPLDSLITRISLTFGSLLSGGGLLLCDSSPGAYHGIFFYTTFFTSVWLWLFMLGLKAWPWFTRLHGQVLDADRHPVGVALTIAGLAMAIVIIPVGYIVMLAELAGC